MKLAVEKQPGRRENLLSPFPTHVYAPFRYPKREYIRRKEIKGDATKQIQGASICAHKNQYKPLPLGYSYLFFLCFALTGLVLPTTVAPFELLFGVDVFTAYPLSLSSGTTSTNTPCPSSSLLPLDPSPSSYPRPEGPW